MTGDQPQHPPLDFDADRLRRLAAALCDDCLSEEHRRELESTLSASPAARRMYVRYMNLHAGLEWEVTSRESVAEMVPAAGRVSKDPPLVAAWRRQWWALLAIAAGLLVAISAVVWQWRGSRPFAEFKRSHTAAESANIPRGNAAPATSPAVVSKHAPDAQWSIARRNDPAPARLRENDVVCVTQGQMEVTFDCGAVVTLYAPAMMEVVSPMKGRAIRGKLAAYVADGAEGFTIETPRATVVDLGTVFGVEVGDEGETDVVVFKGAVDLHFDAGGAGPLSSEPQRLTSGEAVRIDKRGTPSRIVSIASDRFADRPDYHAAPLKRPVLISAVRDNIERDSRSWNYYEIVHGGMQEDAKAFVDRDAHEWNGLEPSGMPAFLIGGDFVKTFNNDKYAHDIELFVSVVEPCRLFILIDDRITPPAWLRREFHDTGFDVGLDVGPFYRVEDGVLVDDRLPGVGPGVSIDDRFSIWERKIETPQLVHLGAPEAAHRYVNMYGIVAVPLDPD